MKYSVYVMMPPSIDPTSFAWQMPLAWDSAGNVTHSEWKPAHINHKKFNGKYFGVLICARKMSLDVPPIEAPQ